MRKYVSLLSLLLLLSTQLFAQSSLIVKEGAGGMQVYPSLSLALSSAQNGDVIYLPGGHLNESVVVEKSVSIIGNGFDPSISVNPLPTSIVSLNIHGTSNVSIHGIRINQDVLVDSSSNVLIKRCAMDGSLTLLNTSTFSLEGSLLTTYFEGNDQAGIVLQSSVIGDVRGLNGALVDNCVIYNLEGTCNCNPFPIASSNTVYRNNILLKSHLSIHITNSNVFQNNLCWTSYTVPTNGTGISQNNAYCLNQGDVFRDVSSNPGGVSIDNDYRLGPNSQAIGMGLNGVDCGIYGGSAPFKMGGLPFNPHIQSIQVDGVTDPNGNLQIQATVEAQDR